MTDGNTGGAPAAVTLPPRYYLENFHRLWHAVEDQYSDLLLPDEHAFMGRLLALPDGAQCLYVRLVSRVGPSFRASKLSYAEIDPLAPALAALIAAGLVDELCSLDLETLGRLFTRAEVSDAYAADLALAKQTAKAQLIDAVAAFQETDEQRWLRMVAGGAEQLVAPAGVELIALLQLLFFGNQRQGLVDFVLSDLGVARYYPYRIERSQRLFASRAAVDEYLACTELADLHWFWREGGPGVRQEEEQEAEQEAELPELVQAALSMAIEFPSSRRRWSRLCNNLGRDCERQGLHALALQLYARSELHPARERRVRVLEASGDTRQALRECETILAQPWCEAEQAAAERIERRLRRTLESVRIPRVADRFASHDLCVVPATGSVERDAANVLAEQAQWRSVSYVENSLMNGLFGLAFWEQIFSTLPGVFHHPYQSAPADMYSADFYRQRRTAVDQRLAALASVDLERELVNAYRSYAGYQCRWLDWRWLSEELVANAARCIPFDHLCAVWRRILFDPAENRRGFPDLVAFGEGVGDYALIEVKGPGDTLQEHQRRWLNYLAQRDVPVSVLRVSWRDA